MSSHLACPESLLIPHGITHHTLMSGKKPLLSYHKFCFLKNLKSSSLFQGLPHRQHLNRLMKYHHPPIPTHSPPFIIILTFLRSFLFLPSTQTFIQNEKAKWQQMSSATQFVQTKNRESKAINSFILLCPSVHCFPRQQPLCL